MKTEVLQTYLSNFYSGLLEEERMPGLIEADQNLDDELFWTIFHEFSHDFWMLHDDWSNLLATLSKRAASHKNIATLPKKDRELYDGLPDEVEIFQARPDGDYNLSWSLGEDAALDSSGEMCQAFALKSNVLAVYANRGHPEVLILPEYVQFPREYEATGRTRRESPSDYNDVQHPMEILLDGVNQVDWQIQADVFETAVAELEKLGVGHACSFARYWLQHPPKQKAA